jgi:hypothetical protein
VAGGFVKLYGSLLLGSSLMDESVEARWLFVCFLSAADGTGFVRCQTPGNAARIANLTLDQAAVALDVLSSPDPHSTTGDQEGRRIVRAEGGWRVVNYAKYREMRTERQLRNAEYQATHRQRLGLTSKTSKQESAEVSASPTSVVGSLGEGSGERGEPALPPADRAERSIRFKTEALRTKLYALIDAAVSVDPKKRDATELMRLFTGYEKRDGTHVGGVVNAALLTYERLEKSIADAEQQIAEWRKADVA